MKANYKLGQIVDFYYNGWSSGYVKRIIPFSIPDNTRTSLETYIKVHFTDGPLKGQEMDINDYKLYAHHSERFQEEYKDYVESPDYCDKPLSDFIEVTLKIPLPDGKPRKCSIRKSDIIRFSEHCVVVSGGKVIHVKESYEEIKNQFN